MQTLEEETEKQTPKRKNKRKLIARKFTTKEFNASITLMIK